MHYDPESGNFELTQFILINKPCGTPSAPVTFEFCEDRGTIHFQWRAGHHVNRKYYLSGQFELHQVNLI